MLKKVVDLSNSNLQKNADSLLATKMFYRSETVENAYLKIYLLFPTKFICNFMQQYAISNCSMETYIHLFKIEWFDWYFVCL